MPFSINGDCKPSAWMLCFASLLYIVEVSVPEVEKWTRSPAFNISHGAEPHCDL